MDTKLDTTHPTPPTERDRKAWQTAYNMWLKTQKQFSRENEHDEEEDR